MALRRIVLFAAILAVVGYAVAALLLHMRGRAAGVYTAAQAGAGSALYSQTCSGCHGTDFQGSGDAPALAGDDFMLGWGSKRVRDLVAKIHDTMPPTAPAARSSPEFPTASRCRARCGITCR